VAEEQEKQAGQPEAEEIGRRLEEEFKKLRVVEVLLPAAHTLASLGWSKLAPDNRDLEQARQAIDVLRALVPQLKGLVEDDVYRSFDQTLVSMQLAYAKAVQEAGGKPEGG